MEPKDIFEEVEEIPEVERGAALPVARVWDNKGIQELLKNINSTKTKKAAVSVTKFVQAYYTDEDRKEELIKKVKKAVANPDDRDTYREGYRVVHEIKRKLTENAKRLGIELDPKKTGIRNKNVGTLYVTIKSGPKPEKEFSGTVTVE